MSYKTRSEAMIAGALKYSTGQPCKNGHLSERYTSSGICCRCNVEASRAITSRYKKIRNAKLQGHFSYALHPDDHAAALAYCQALDLQRGRLPPAAPRPANHEGPDPAQIDRAVALAMAATRERLIPAPLAPYLPKP